MLGEGDTSSINGSFGATEKKFSVNFTKAKTKSPLGLHYNGIIVISLLMEKKSLILKPRCNAFNDLCNRVCIPNKTEDLNF